MVISIHTKSTALHLYGIGTTNCALVQITLVVITVHYFTGFLSLQVAVFIHFVNNFSPFTLIIQCFLTIRLFSNFIYVPNDHAFRLCVNSHRCNFHFTIFFIWRGVLSHSICSCATSVFVLESFIFYLSLILYTFPYSFPFKYSFNFSS